MKDVMKHFGIDAPEIKKPDGLKPKKPAKKLEEPEGPEVKSPKKPDENRKTAEPDQQKPVEPSHTSDKQKSEGKKSEL